ncbi:SET domain-containing protein [Neptuniibacter sp.]|uniref:SET domain-containing protein-lysine N-methyltransferase n=1 Tax=Neptuniibacter sp. TaxID=1962643 RepID=UPI002607CE11|nr:SET domain-containing protein [Neptuniibacter sp.]MCP4598271.1 SET domain-containing protein [Neptuniibacter sp.]
MKELIKVESHGVSGVGRAVYAAKDISKNETVIRSRQLKILPHRDKFSLELKGKHILIDQPGVLVNHSCQPNCYLVANQYNAYDFIALKEISAGEEITFDYETIESQVVGFNQCHCGSDLCRGAMNSQIPNLIEA